MKPFFLCLFLLVMPTASTWANSPPVIIGLNADMSAVAAEGGEAIRRGAQIAIDEINAQGGLLGHPLKLRVRDHRGNPARGLSNIRQFAAQDDLLAVLGGIHTPVVLKELAEVHQQELLYLIPWAAGTPIIDNGFEPNYVFRLSVRDEHAGHVLMRHAKQRGFTKTALLLERTGWGRSNNLSMKAAAKNLGLSVVATEWFNWREVSMGNQLARIQASGAEVILLVANAPEGATIVKKMSSFDEDKKLPILSHWGVSTGAFVANATLANILKTDLSILQTYSFLNPGNDNKKQKILTAYKENFDATVTAESVSAVPGVVHAYDLVHMLALAVKAADSFESPKVRSALESIDYYEGLFKTFKQPFSPSRHDALSKEDYILSRYNDNGFLVPIN